LFGGFTGVGVPTPATVSIKIQFKTRMARFLHKRADLCVFGGGQLLQREESVAGVGTPTPVEKRRPRPRSMHKVILACSPGSEYLLTHVFECHSTPTNEIISRPSYLWTYARPEDDC